MNARWKPVLPLPFLWRIDYIVLDPQGEYAMMRVEDGHFVESLRIVAAPCQAGHPAPAAECSCGLYASPNWATVRYMARQVAQRQCFPIIISRVMGEEPAYISGDLLVVRASGHTYVALGLVIVLPTGEELVGEKTQPIRQALEERLSRAAG